MQDDVVDIPRVCMGFALHHPVQLDPAYASGLIEDRSAHSPFSSKGEEERIRRLSASSYIPTLHLLIRMMDEGFCCSFLISGSLLEALERIDQHLYELLSQAASHRHAELLSETYYSSVIGIFSDIEEYRMQVEMHRSLMMDFSGKKPGILVATDSVFNRAIAGLAQNMGFSALYTDVFGRNHQMINPTEQYQLGGIPILIRHCELSDDISLRYGKVDWVHHPLSPSTYAGWIAGLRGGAAHVMVDIETFGGRFPGETGIFEFLESLPAAYEEAGVHMALPSDLVDMNVPPNPIPDDAMEMLIGLWPTNMMQCTALEALRTAGRWVTDRTTWRRFQAMDHFRAMATTPGACGRLTTKRTQAEAHEAFSVYLSALSRFEEEEGRKIRSRSAARILRCVPPERAFHFCSPAHYEEFSAHSLEEFLKLLDLASDACICHHIEQGDFSTWIREVIMDMSLASRIQPLRERSEIREVIRERIFYLWNRLK